MAKVFFVASWILGDLNTMSMKHPFDRNIVTEVEIAKSDALATNRYAAASNCSFCV